MSREIVMAEAASNKRYEKDLNFFLSQYPATEWEIRFEAVEDEGYFYVRITPIELDGIPRSFQALKLPLHRVPTISAELVKTGALTLLFDQVKKRLEDEIDVARVALTNEAVDRITSLVTVKDALTLLKEGKPCFDDQMQTYVVAGATYRITVERVL